MIAQPEGVLFSADELTPVEWSGVAREGPVRAFNPALLAHERGWIFAYRFVAADGLRRIGLCLLDRDLRVIRGSARPLSDGFRLANAAAMPEVARTWFADPRLYRFGRRLFVYWNSGWHEPRNYQFLHELDPVSLRPIGTARELILRTGERQKLEKNWTLFSSDGREVFAVYSVTPHRILRVSLETEGDIACSDVSTTPWALTNFPASHGGLRGGTPPHGCDGGFVSLCHSVHDGPEGYRYCVSAYRFAGTSGFAPTHEPVGVIELFNPYGTRRVHPRLNPAVADVAYPCGLARDGATWLVSHGINDEHCAISRLSQQALSAAMRPRPLAATAIA